MLSPAMVDITVVPHICTPLTLLKIGVVVLVANAIPT
jgi:hypothetical protein